MILKTMLSICVLAGLSSNFDYASAATAEIEDAGDGDSLMLAFVVHRHGERTPAEEEAALSKDREVIDNLIQLEGYEGLTNVGKRRAYELGKFFRHRYGSEGGRNVLSKVYMKDEIAVRSTAKDRTQMTAQISMAALYPPEPKQQWDSVLGMIWQPVPYTAVPLVEDYLRYYSNCEYFKSLMRQAKQIALKEEFAPFMDLVPLIAKETGANFTEDPLQFQTLFDLFRSQVGLGMDIPSWAKPVLARLAEAARLSYKLYFRNDEMKRIGGGVLLNDFIETAKKIKSGQTVKQPIRVFSSHDFNIGSLMEVAQIEECNRNIPEYGALVALELYKSKSNGKFYVLPIYLPQAGGSLLQILQIKNCDSHCDFDKFVNITANYVLPEKEYYKLCSIKTEL